MKQLIILLSFFSMGSLWAQKDSVYTGTKAVKKPNEQRKLPEWQEKITYGGNIQAYLGNPTFLYLSPAIGYQITDNLNIGVGVIYNHISGNYYGTRYSSSIFGGHSYLRFNVTESFFLQGQYDRLLQPDYYGLDPHKKIWVNYAMAGFGYMQRLGSNVAMTTSLMYNFTYDRRYSIYPTPVVFQVGFMAYVK